MFEITTLGAFHVRTADGTSVAALMAQPKRAALLLYLALARPAGAHRRDTLVGLFWADSTERRARKALNQTIYTLRKVLGADAILTHGDTLELNARRVRCDATEMEQRLSTGDVAALELYAGDLLPGFHLEDCAEFSLWLESARERLRSRAADAAAAEGARIRDVNPAGAAKWLRFAAQRRPYDESAHTALADALSAAGDRAGAVIELERYEQRLRADLDLEPSPAVAKHLAKLRAGSAAPPSAPAPPPVLSDSPGPVPPLDEPLSVDEPSRRRGWTPGRVAAAAAVAVVAMAGVAASSVGIPPASTTGPGGALVEHRIVILPLHNRSGDPALDPLGPLAADWIVQTLAGAGLVEVVPIQSVIRPRGEISDLVPRLLHETGARYVMDGSFLRSGDSLFAEARILDGRSGTVARAIEMPAYPADLPMELVRDLRRRLSGALATLVDPRLSSWSDAASQPPSLEAYSAYVDALEIFLGGPAADRWARAATAFRKAAALDTAFTTPLLWAIQAHFNGGDALVAKALADSLLAFREALRPWDRAMLDFLAADIAPDPEGAYRAAGRLVQLAPSSEWRFKRAAAALYTNRPVEAMETLLAIDPDQGWLRSWPAYWSIRLQARHRAGQFQGELEDAERVRAGHPGLARHHSTLAEIGMGRAITVLERLDTVLARAQPIVAMGRAYGAVLEIHRHGPREAVGPAMALLARSVDAYLATEAAESDGPTQRLGEALMVLGRLDEADRVFRALYASDPTDWQAMGYLGMIAALRGDTTAAGAWDRRIEALSLNQGEGEETVYRAGIAAHLGNPGRAVALLDQARREGLFWHGELYRRPHLWPLHGYPPFETMLRPRDGT